jgi:hypothetical protein
MTKKNIELNRSRRLLKKKIRRSRKALRQMSLVLKDILEEVDDYDDQDVARVMHDVDNIYPVAAIPAGLATGSVADEPPDLEYTPIETPLHQNPDDDDDDDLEDNPDDDDYDDDDDDFEDNPDDEDEDDED